MRRAEPAPLRVLDTERRPWREVRGGAPEGAAAGIGEGDAAAVAVAWPDRIPGARVQRLLNAAGAVVSLSLVAGLAIWGYKLAVRDVTGIPVIRALGGPARVAPADPGGELARHLGLAVNAVTAEGAATPPPDTLTLAPPPAELLSADMPMGALAAAAPPAASAAAPEAAAPPAAAVEPLTGEPLGPEGQIVDPIAVPPEPRPGPAAVPAAVPGVAVSPRPRLKPGTAAPAAADA
ncbi:MAG: hypothetical protein ACOY4T_03020, partial [Pseudomonadota bacterium]